jgi:aspartate/methionine/tyrosine aminotransferase
MNSQQRTMDSPYMHWAKTHFHAKYNLANSGIMNYPLSRLPVKFNDLAITGETYYGYPPLLREIGKRYDVRTDNIYTTLGTSFANYAVLEALYEPGDEIIIEHPTYELLLTAAAHVGYSVKRLYRRPENQFCVNPDDLRSLITQKTKLILLTNLHNPASVYIDNKTLKSIGEAAQKFGAFVCVDEVYLDAIFGHSPRSSIHLGENFIVTNSLTKIYGLSGLRCGWVLAQPAIVEKLWRLTDLMYANHVHISEQVSTTAFIHLDELRMWARSILETNHKTLDAFLDGRDDLEVIRPGFGTVVFPRLKNGNVETLSTILNSKYDTAITPGRYFEMPDHFRIGLGSDPEYFSIGIENLQKALNEI